MQAGASTGSRRKEFKPGHTEHTAHLRSSLPAWAASPDKLQLAVLHEREADAGKQLIEILHGAQGGSAANNRIRREA